MLTPEQLALRKTGICASEVAAVAGLSPYRKPIDVWSDKLDLVEPFTGNQASKWGDLLEEVIADHYKKEHEAEKVLLRSPGTLVREISSRFRLIATPDRLVYRKRQPRPFRNLQIKTAGLRQADKWGEGPDDVPEEYLAQVAAEMAVADVGETDLAVLIGGQDDREYRLKRDLEFEGQLIEICERFWIDHILTQTPPPVDGSQQYSEYLKRRFPESTKPLLPATVEAGLLANDLRQQQETCDLEDERAEQLRNALKALIGEAGGIEGLCTWKQNRPSVVTDWKAVATYLSGRLTELDGPAGHRYLSEAVAKYTAEKPGARVFRLLNPKEK